MVFPAAIRAGQLLGQHHLGTHPAVILKDRTGLRFLGSGQSVPVEALEWERSQSFSRAPALPVEGLTPWSTSPGSSEPGASVAMVTWWGKSSGESAAVFLALGNEMEQLEGKVSGSQGPQGPGAGFGSRAGLGEGAQDGQHLQVPGNNPWEEKGMRRSCSVARRRGGTARGHSAPVQRVQPINSSHPPLHKWYL